MEEEQSNRHVFEKGQGRPVPQFLAEECPYYDWAWPAETPRYFAVDIFSENSAYRVFSDEATEWYSRDLTAKLKSMVPKPRNENKKTEDEVDNAAKMIQKQWRIRRDTSYTNVSESKITREFGHPEDSLQADMVGKSAARTMVGNKSLSTLLRTVQMEECVNNDQPELREFVCDISEIKDEVSAQRESTNSSRFSQSRDVTSNADKFSKKAQESKNQSQGNLPKKQDDDKSFYSFANKPKPNHHENSIVSEQAKLKSKKKNAIVYVPGSSRTSSSSNTLQKADTLQRGDSYRAEEGNPASNSMDDLIFKTVQVGGIEGMLNDSAESRPLEDLLSESVMSLRDHAAIEPAALFKKLDFGAVVANEVFGYANETLQQSDRSYQEEEIEVKIQVDFLLMTKECFSITLEKEMPNNDISIDVPPLHSSMQSAPQKPSSKQKANLAGRKGKNKQIEVVMIEEQENPKSISVERTKHPVKVDPDAQAYDSAQSNSHQKKPQRGTFKDVKPHCCKNSEVPLVKGSGTKRPRKECAACRHSAQKEQNKENKNNDRVSPPLSTIMERRTCNNGAKNSAQR